MVIRFGLQKNGETSITEINNYILSCSGLEWKRNKDNTIVLPKITITVPNSLDIAIDDYVEISFDQVVRLRTYVIEVKNNYEKRKKTIVLNDLISKLNKYYMGAISSSDWAGYEPTIEEYQYHETSYLTRYIQAVFLIKVMIHKATGIDINNIDSTGIDNENSFFKYKKDGGVYVLKKKELYFYFPQLLYIGKNTVEEGIDKTSNFKDIFIILLQMLHIQYKYEDNIIKLINLSDYYEMVPDKTYSYDITGILPGIERCNCSLVKLEAWRVLKYLDTEWESDTTITEEIMYPEIYNIDRNLSIQLPDHFELYRKENSVDQVVALNPDTNPYFLLYADIYDSFLEQYCKTIYSLFAINTIVYKIKTDIEYNLRTRCNRMDVKDRTSYIEYRIISL